MKCSCEICGAEFVSETETRFCSKRCVNKHAYIEKRKGEACKPSIINKCVVCGNDCKASFRSDVRYCSKQCQRAAQLLREVEREKANPKPTAAKEETKPKKAHDRVCKVCGKTFKAFGPNEQLCSEECKKARTREWRREKVPLRACLECGKEFKAIKTGVQKFCSDECRERFCSGEETRTCLKCGKLFNAKRGSNVLRCSACLRRTEGFTQAELRSIDKRLRERGYIIPREKTGPKKSHEAMLAQLEKERTGRAERERLEKAQKQKELADYLKRREALIKKRGEERYAMNLKLREERMKGNQK